MEQYLKAEPRLMTATELAEYLAISTRTVARMRASGEIPAIRVRSVWRYDAEQVVEVLMHRGLAR